MSKILIFTAVFYFLALLQASFLAHFSFFGFSPNFIFIAVVLINFFVRSKNTGFASAFLGGFFLDVFSSGQIGWHILILMSTAILIKIALNYVRIPVK